MPKYLADLRIAMNESVEVAKALASQLRINILEYVNRNPSTVNQIATQFEIPLSTAAANIKKLEDVGLLAIELVPGSHGTKKICRSAFGGIYIHMRDRIESNKHVTLHMPIGHYSDCEVTPTCGLISDTSIIGEFDRPSAFFELEHVNAQLIWFRQGYLEYRFPNKLPPGTKADSLTLTMEICSEAPMHNPDWPSDITLWINGTEIGYWTSPGDFGGERGIITPDWWGPENTQYGLWKTWTVDSVGSFVDGIKLSEVTLDDLRLVDNPSIRVRIGVKDDAVNVGGKYKYVIL